jgi:hypothetical protein
MSYMSNMILMMSTVWFCASYGMGDIFPNKDKFLVINGVDMRLQVSIFLSILGLTVLPISAVVGNCISNIYEDRSVFYFSYLLSCV